MDPSHVDFALHCHCQVDRTGQRPVDRADQRPAYQFWLNALGPNVHVNGRKVEMTNSLINIMHNSVSLIQTSSRKARFYLFIQLHEVYWPAVDKNISWDQHFFPMGVDKIPCCRLSAQRHKHLGYGCTLTQIRVVRVPEKFKQTRRINQWMDGIEEPLWDPDEEPYHQHNDPPIARLENRLPVTGSSQGLFSARTPIVGEEAQNTRHPFGILTTPRTATTPRLTAISSGWGNPEGVKNSFGHRRSSRIQGNILLRSQNTK